MVSYGAGRDCNEPCSAENISVFLLHETGTVKEIRKALPDIPSASLYRHIKILADCSILMVVGENRIRGTVESVYQLNKDAMATEDETGNAVQMSLLSICASFAKYFPPAMPIRKRICCCSRTVRCC